MRILIAEDDDIFRSLITELLEQAGYKPLPAANGLLAWELLQREGADMLVTDINMPEMDGFQLLARVRADAKYGALPVLMLTIRDFAEDQITGYETGADDYLIKPFDASVFVARVKVLQRRILRDRPL